MTVVYVVHVMCTYGTGPTAVHMYPVLIHYMYTVQLYTGTEL